MVLGLLTTSQALDEIGSTRGSILYRAASGWAALTPGTVGQVLTSSGVGADPIWSAASSSTTWNGIAAATGNATTANGNNEIVYNVSKTTNNAVSWAFGESSAATGGTSTSGVPNQVLLKLSTLASSTMSSLSVYSRGTHVFSVSPTAAQILGTDGTRTNPTYGFAGDTGMGLARNGSTFEFCIGGALRFDVNASQVRGPKGTAAAPTYTENVQSADSGLFFPDSGMLAVSCAGRELLRWVAASAGGGWQIMDEADSNPTTTNLDASDSVAIYTKANALVFAYNLAGTINYLTIPLDGSTTTWTNSTTAP